MSKLLTRRTLITTGLVTAAGASGIGAAARYGLIPPDYATPFGAGETLTYATQRLLTSGHSMAREFTRSDISKIPIVNGPAPPDEPFRLRVFVDRSVVEVFVNGRLCLAMRVCPSRDDSVRVSLRAQGQDAELKSLDAWHMKSIWQ